MNSNSEVAYASDMYSQVGGTSAGLLLREARIAAGVHIESIAFSLKVPVSKIEALENDDLTALPDAVFARALTSSVCRALKIDSAPVLALLPQAKAQWLPANDAGVNAAFRDESERFGGGGAMSRLSRPLGLAVIVLLVGAGLIAWVPSDWLNMEFFKTQPTTTTVSPSLAIESTEQQSQTTERTELPDPAAAVQVAAPVEAAIAEGNPSSVAPEAASVAALTTPRLQLSARGETWIQVKDAQGVVVLERILREGDTATVNQLGRLSVVVGRADITDVVIDGKKLDIASTARENVARFEVKP